MCMNGDIDPTDECCDLPAPPDVADACDGSQSVVNPASCTGDGTVVTHLLTQLEILGDCNAGYDLDSCNGSSCIAGGLAPGEGTDGTDNALAGLAPVLVGVGGNLGGVNTAFQNSLCGLTDSEEGTCDMEVPVLALTFQVDADADENCANVTMFAGETEVGTVAMNLVDGCLSGTLPNIPLEIGGTEGAMGNVTLSATVSEGGFSNGVLGSTVDADTAVAIAEALLPGAGAVVGQVFDINEDLSGDNGAGCNALSGTYSVGGVVEAAQ
jgi:hypothetical protein